jgi:hypothetical protein
MIYYLEYVTVKLLEVQCIKIIFTIINIRLEGPYIT